jgi:hypothetical protein
MWVIRSRTTASSEALAIARGIEARNPGAKVLGSMKLDWVDVNKLEFPESRLFADPKKHADMGPFDWKLYEPVWVDRTASGRLVVSNGVTRVTAAKRAGVKMLPVYIFSEP